ncbi:hypothetical protein LEP1GSC103_0679 [Leptospira borgpetersenii serovar Javanica str. UI 09931]|uniref:Lipoprotein n=1 Tax=Leptospira borgpetersenii serovar Javanica str. UI 09931 TaxID=1049767 RepID=A0AAV3J8F3_LEPBO|nr:hypothetical protein LEP1GSC101_1156 [Leptospira borgpetersenii str. UI 09149]EMN59054.1 hypothetical protein LEP1GSC090_2704 [Leptospira borgpetersenii serovar Javanica str. MK146]EPG55914.1 hypothetical protein LEP1GSC103_0679 [Leptospira borgpetersenii serovar Javanica str. UI 09931]
MEFSSDFIFTGFYVLSGCFIGILFLSFSPWIAFYLRYSLL